MLELFKFKNKHKDLRTPKYLLDEGEPNYYTIAEQNLEYYREAGKLEDKNEKLTLENELLKDKVKELDDIAFKTTQENAILTDRIEDLESDLEAYEKKIGKGKDESDVYKANALDKTTKEKEVYKKTINIMCDKFGIEHSEVYKIIDNIKEKDNKSEREK